jgi:putative transposase
VTASTHGKLPHFSGAKRLAVVQRGLLKVAEDFGWQLEAWAVFSNHYHFVGKSPRQQDDAGSLGDMLSVLHTKLATWINKLDAQPGREVWHNFWDTKLTHQRSYLVHQNAVKHRLVPVASQYPWCSASWFERTSPEAIVKSIYNFKFDRLSVADDYPVAQDW